MNRSLFVLFIAIVAVPTSFASGLPKASVQAIIKSLQDSNLEVRTAAAQALAQAPEDSAAKTLENALISSSEPAEQEALAKALEAIKDRDSAKRLSDAIANPQFTWGTGAKARAVSVIGHIGERKMAKWLTDVVSGDQEPAVRAAALRALGEIGAPPKKDNK